MTEAAERSNDIGGHVTAEPLAFDLAETDGSINQRLEAVAIQTPDAAALSDGEGQRFTFAELLEATNGAGRWLVQRLGDDESPVAVMMGHGPMAVAVELAVLAAGRIVVPLDPSFPPPRLAEMLRQAAPSLLLCDSGSEELARELGAVDIEVVGQLPYVDPGDVELPRTEGRTPAFLLFTSGSTGEPKGVVSNHRAFLSGARDLARAGVFVPGDRLAMVAPLNFAASPCQTFWAMLAGAEVCMFALRARGMPAFVQWLESVGITAFAAVPTLARGVAANCTRNPLSSLRVVLVGGEALEVEDVALIRSSSRRQVDIVPLYVATEMMLMSWAMVPGDGPAEDPAVRSVGDPVEGRRLSLEPLEAADRDDVGEIVVEAPVVSAGYWKAPELTADRFEIDHAADRMVFRTGDIGRTTPHGIEIVGRSDSMVKVNGFRVELGAIEAAIRSVPGVGHVAVAAVEVADGKRRLVAHVAGAADEEPPDPAAIRSHLRSELPFHMVPARIVVHEALPMLPNGKVDRFRLAQQGFVLSDSAASPRTETERRVAALFADLLGLEDVGIDEDFFELGGDSLLAVQVVITLEEDHGVEFPMSNWVDNATVERIAEFVDGSSTRPSRTTLVRLKNGRSDRAPLFVVNDLHGSAHRFLALAAALPHEQPVWGFDSPLLEGRAGDPQTIEEIAAVHTQDMRRAFPDGPYHLLGYSSNVLVVFEMVRQLLDEGEEPGFVGLVDFGPVHLRHTPRRREGPRPPGGWPERAPSQLSMADRLRFHASRLRSLPSADRPAYFARVLDRAKEFDMALARRDLRRRGRVRPELRGANAWYLQMEAALRYEPRPVDAEAVLFLSDQTAKGNMMVSRKLDHASATDPELGWGPLFAGGVTVEPVVGHHNDLVERPYVEGLGAVIGRALELRL